MGFCCFHSFALLSAFARRIVPLPSSFNCFLNSEAPACQNTETKQSSGIRFGQVSYHCADCGTEFCANCQSSHAVLHATSIVRFTIYSWPPQQDVAAKTASCSRCAAEVNCRIECSDCLSCICDDCAGFSQALKEWYKHREQHARVKGFISLYPPTANVIPPTSSGCECLTMRGCVSHCGRCYRGKLTDFLIPVDFYRLVSKRRSLQNLSTSISDGYLACKGPSGSRKGQLGRISGSQLLRHGFLISLLIEVLTNLIANKIGESLYLCRPCKQTYNSSFEICEQCYASEQANHPGHQFSRLAITRVTNMPDSADTQLTNWWRCAAPGCNLGRCPLYTWSQSQDRGNFWPFWFGNGRSVHRHCSESLIRESVLELVHPTLASALNEEAPHKPQNHHNELDRWS